MRNNLKKGLSIISTFFLCRSTFDRSFLFYSGFCRGPDLGSLLPRFRKRRRRIIRAGITPAQELPEKLVAFACRRITRHHRDHAFPVAQTRYGYTVAGTGR